MEEIYLAGGCLWGVQEFLRHLPGVCETEAGRANGTKRDTQGDYDGYAECVKTVFDPKLVTVEELMAYLFEIIDPYSLNRKRSRLRCVPSPTTCVAMKRIRIG
jgi:peptide-methionine (S)-S-oxide reductase